RGYGSDGRERRSIARDSPAPGPERRPRTPVAARAAQRREAGEPVARRQAARWRRDDRRRGNGKAVSARYSRSWDTPCPTLARSVAAKPSPKCVIPHTRPKLILTISRHARRGRPFQVPTSRSAGL